MATATLIDYTGAGRPDQHRHAADMLVFSKSTRLKMEPGLLDRIKAMSDDELRAELDYMAGTIPSSWEMIDVTFLISDVSRAAAQQITRTRTGSYAMQSQRVTDVREAGAVNPLAKNDPNRRAYNGALEQSFSQYETLVESGVPLQDARGVLPINARCNLMAKYNFRSFVELMQARASLRVQGEYADLAQDMKAEVLRAWPWAEAFFRPKNDRAIGMLEDVVSELGLEAGRGAGWQIAKAIDLIRKGG